MKLLTKSPRPATPYRTDIREQIAALKDHTPAVLDEDTVPKTPSRAGRPESRLTRYSRSVGDKWLADGNEAPLERMLKNMRYFAEEADRTNDPDKAEHLRRQSQDCAASAAPFMHPRLQAIAVAQTDKVPWHIILSPGDELL